MIFNTTYTDKEITFKINKLVGRPYSFFKRIRMGGIGSRRMIILKNSAVFEPYLNENSTISYANIELRPNGIIIHLNKKSHNYMWVIPFYQLAIYKSEGLTIHGQGLYLGFKNAYVENKSFIDKIIRLKSEFMGA